MQNFIALIVKYGIHILFISLEIICFYLIISNNASQKSIWQNSTSLFADYLERRVDKVNNYIHLEEANDSLIAENASLLQRLIKADLIEELAEDSLSNQYELIPSYVCNNTIHLRNNYLTLCKGENDGIEMDMGVISSTGIIGIVKEVNPHYARVISILHSQSKISCALKKSGAFGSLIWSGYLSQEMNLTSIPKHIDLRRGDTVVTSGYSTIFPKNIPVGTVSDFSVDRGSSNYNIEVKLLNDPIKTKTVYAIKNNLKEFQRAIEIDE